MYKPVRQIWEEERIPEEWKRNNNSSYTQKGIER